MASASTLNRRRKDKKKDAEEGGPPKHETEASGKRSSVMNVLFVASLFSACAFALYYLFPQFFWEEPANTIRLEQDSQLPFKVVDLPGKGKGVIATRDIAQGELLFREEPLFLVPTSISMSPGPLLLTLLARLTPTERKRYYDLSYVNFPSGLKPDSPEYHEALALAIFQTNSIAAGNGQAGIFPNVARLNHGCSKAFNSVYSWRANEGKRGLIVVHALKGIKEGEELLTTYLDTKRPRDARRGYLHDHYGFTCQCSVCTLADELSRKSDERLARMADLYGKFATWGSDAIDGKEAVTVAREIWSIGEEEGYWSERGRLAADAAWVAAAHSDADAVQEWAALGLEWYAYELGADSEQVKEMKDIMGSPRSHPVWGSKRELRVGGPGNLSRKV